MNGSDDWSGAIAPLGLERVQARQFGAMVLPQRLAASLAAEWRTASNVQERAVIWDKYLSYEIPLSQIVGIADAITLLRRRGILDETRVQLAS
jgi:hypothetical protein